MIIDLTNLDIEQSKLLTEVYSEMPEEFNQMVEGIYSNSNKSLGWLFSNILSRDVYQCDLVYICAYLALIKRMLEENKKITKIILDNNNLEQVLTDYFKSNKLAIQIENRNHFRFKIFLINSLRPFFFILKNIDWALRNLYVKDQRRLNLIPKNESLIILDTFLLPNSLEGNIYKDMYYNNIFTFLSKEEKKSVFYLPGIKVGINKKNIQEAFLKSDNKFIFIHDFLTLKDYAKGLAILFNKKWKRSDAIYFYGFNVRPVIMKINRRKQFIGSSFKAVLNYLFVQKLIISGFKVKLLVDWNENQASDKGLIKGFHTFSPDTSIKGYQGFITSPEFYFHLCPTPFEIQNEVIPDEMVVIGKNLLKRIKKFSPSLPVSVGPALRHLTEKVISNGYSHIKRAVVLLPLEIQNSVSCISIIAELEEIINNNPFEIFIKPHPAINFESIVEIAKSKLKFDFKMINCGLSKALENTDLVIGHGTGAMIEALTNGIPCIILGNRNGITENPVPLSIDHSIWRICYTSDELKESVVHFLTASNHEKEKYNIMAEAIRHDYFTPATRENVVALLNL